MKEICANFTPTSRRRFVQTMMATVVAAPLASAQTPTPPAQSLMAAAYLEVARACLGAQIKAGQGEGEART